MNNMRATTNNLNDNDYLVLYECKKGYISTYDIGKKHSLHPQKIINSLFKLLRKGYIDGDYKFISTPLISDSKLKVGQNYFEYTEVKKLTEDFEHKFDNNIKKLKI